MGRGAASGAVGRDDPLDHGGRHGPPGIVHGRDHEAVRGQGVVEGPVRRVLQGAAVHQARHGHLLQGAGQRAAQLESSKDFAKADAARDALTAAGWIVEDVPGGARVKKA